VADFRPTATAIGEPARTTTLVPAVGGKLTRQTYGADLHRMLDEWARTWGATVAQATLSPRSWMPTSG